MICKNIKLFLLLVITSSNALIFSMEHSVAQLEDELISIIPSKTDDSDIYFAGLKNGKSIHAEKFHRGERAGQISCFLITVLNAQPIHSIKTTEKELDASYFQELEKLAKNYSSEIQPYNFKSEKISFYNFLSDLK